MKPKGKYWAFNNMFHKMYFGHIKKKERYMYALVDEKYIIIMLPISLVYLWIVDFGLLGCGPQRRDGEWDGVVVEHGGRPEWFEEGAGSWSAAILETIGRRCDLFDWCSRVRAGFFSRSIVSGSKGRSRSWSGFQWEWLWRCWEWREVW